MQLHRVRDERRQCSACGLWVMDSVAIYLPYHHLGFHLCIADLHTLTALLQDLRDTLLKNQEEATDD